MTRQGLHPWHTIFSAWSPFRAVLSVKGRQCRQLTKNDLDALDQYRRARIIPICVDTHKYVLCTDVNTMFRPPSNTDHSRGHHHSDLCSDPTSTDCLFTRCPHRVYIAQTPHEYAHRTCLTRLKTEGCNGGAYTLHSAACMHKMLLY